MENEIKRWAGDGTCDTAAEMLREMSCPVLEWRDWLASGIYFQRSFLLIHRLEAVGDGSVTGFLLPVQEAPSIMQTSGFGLTQLPAAVGFGTNG